MKKVFLTFLLGLFSLGFAQIQWRTMSQAQAEARNSGKPILLVFTQVGIAKSPLYPSLQNGIIQRYISENFIPVNYNASMPAAFNFYGRTFGKKVQDPLQDDFVRFMNVSALPTVMFLDSNWQQITSVMGGVSAHDLEPYLSMIASKKYHSIKTQKDWTNYLKSFRYQIKTK